MRLNSGLLLGVWCSYLVSLGSLGALGSLGYWGAFSTFMMACGVANGQASNRYAHRSVLSNAELEATLPSRFLNPFYQDFQIRRALARSSWFGPNEQPVYARPTDSITRREIFTVLNHAGLLPQQQQQQRQRQNF